MEIDGVPYPSVDGWDDDRTAIRRESEMADQGFVQNRVDRLGIVYATLWEAPDL